jgi:uncharacterized protein YndB with AHSA1/START domain
MDTLELRKRLWLVAALLLGTSVVRAQINENAPVITRDTVRIAAPPARVWQALTDIGGWPTRFDFIRKTEHPDAVRVGEHFHWRTTKLKLRSVLLTVKPTEEFGWRGSKVGVRVRHFWYLTPTPDGGTMVVSAESQQGLLVRLLKHRFQHSVEDGSVRWLNQLKTHCETTVTTSANP